MDVLAQLKPTLADRYDVEREIGRGGMATVYLARDVRHGRRVALKVLDPELGAVLGGERFLSEIRVTANLQHPNLLPLFDSGEAGGLLYYVMPFIEGETLRARLEREHQLPVGEAVRIAIAVASALDYAHRQGVIHRDLKPENILLHDGQPLVADFGIALAVSNAGGSRVTQTGLSLGTPQYMSPEQATGDRAFDARTDIYSLGAVVYEMLTGEPPHIGTTAQAVIARLVTEKPRAITDSRASVPAHVNWAVMRALEKLPADRFERAREFAEALEGKASEIMPAPLLPETRARRTSSRTLALAGATCVAVGFGAAWFTGGRTAVEREVVRFPLAAQHGLRLPGGIPGFGVSPSGRLVAYRALLPDGTPLLFTRRLDDPTPRAVKGSVNGLYPIFSPDEAWLAYVNEGQLVKTPLTGGTPVALATVNPLGMQWIDTDDIVFGSTAGVRAVSASGGTPRVISRVDTARGERLHQLPVLLPDGRTLAFAIRDSANAFVLALAPLAGGATRRTDVVGSHPLGMIDGRLIHGTLDGRVLAVPFDIGKGRSTGPAVELLSGVGVGLNGAADIALSASGTLVHDAGRHRYELALVDDRGIARRVVDSLRTYSSPRFSADGQRIAVHVREPGIERLYVLDRRSGTFERVSAANVSASRPEWSPDGRSLLCRITGPAGGLALIALDGDRTPRLLVRGANAGTFTPDGRGIVYVRRDGQLTYRAIGDTTERLIDPAGISGRVSPDGRWIAYQTVESGTFQVYVRPFLASGARVQVSTDGGQAPMWSRDGTRLLYSAAGRTLISASLSSTRGIEVVRRDTLFGEHEYTTVGPNYDFTPDGRGLLVVLSHPAGSWMVVRHWDVEVRRRLRTAE
jgi:eukaryotic-like serine/threonine-protein kinase